MNFADVEKLQQTYVKGLRDGIEIAFESVVGYINDNRTEVTDGVYRDHFSSTDLLNYIVDEYKQGMLTTIVGE